jgi:hypothetical protein
MSTNNSSSLFKSLLYLVIWLLVIIYRPKLLVSVTLWKPREMLNSELGNCVSRGFSCSIVNYDFLSVAKTHQIVSRSVEVSVDKRYKIFWKTFEVMFLYKFDGQNSDKTMYFVLKSKNPQCFVSNKPHWFWWKFCSNVLSRFLVYHVFFYFPCFQGYERWNVWASDFPNWLPFGYYSQPRIELSWIPWYMSRSSPFLILCAPSVGAVLGRGSVSYEVELLK